MKLRRSRKIVSLLVTLSFLITLLVPMVGPATAKSLNSVDRVLSVADYATISAANAPVLIIREDPDFLNHFSSGDTFRLVLPNGIEWNNPVVKVNGVEVPGIAMIRTNRVLEVTFPEGLDDNAIDVVEVALGVILDEVSGEIAVSVEPIDSAVTGGSYMFLVAGGDKTTTIAESVEIIGKSGTGGVIRVEETYINSIGNGQEQLKLMLPGNFKWNNMTSEDISFSGGFRDATIDDMDGNGTTTLIVKFTPSDDRGQRGTIYITPKIKAESAASYGEVEVSIDGTDISDADVVIAEYVDLNVEHFEVWLVDPENKNNKIFLVEYTIAELEQMDQIEREYSAIDRLPAPRLIVAKGIDFENFIKSLNIDLSTVERFRFYSTDAGDYPSGNFRKESLLGETRYYYPKIVEKWDNDSWYRPKFYDGVEDGKIEVRPMFALESSLDEAVERWAKSPPWDNLSGAERLKLCWGQSEPSECNIANFKKLIYKMEVVGKRLPITLTPATTNNSLGNPIEITFTDDEVWRNAITEVKVVGETVLDSDKYTKTEGKITIDADVFGAAGAYTIVIKAQGYKNSTVIQNIVNFQDWPTAPIEPVPSDKIWTIRFNQPVSTTQSLSEHIYVTDTAGKRLDVTCKIGTGDQKSIIVVAPKKGYRSGESYTLWVKGSLQSATGKQLKQPVKLQFKIR